MNQDAMLFIWENLPYRLPGIIVYFVGLCISLSYLTRFPKAAVLVLLSTVLMLMVSIGGLVIFYIQINQRGDPEWWRYVSIALSIADAFATALLLWAAFADRQQYYPPEFFESGGRDDALRRE
jgi:hypothetical protein